MKKIVIIAAALAVVTTVVVGAANVSWPQVAGGQISTQTTTAADAGQVFQSVLTARGVDVTRVELEGGTFRVYQTLTSSHRIEDELGKWAAYRLAADEDFTQIEFVFDSDGQVSKDRFRLHRLWTFPQKDPLDAAKALSSWIADIEAKTGASAMYDYGDSRLSLVIEASVDVAPQVAETFMMGGRAQAEAGNLEQLTLVVKSNSEVVLEGVCDYVVGAQSKIYQAPGLSFDW